MVKLLEEKAKIDTLTSEDSVKADIAFMHVQHKLKRRVKSAKEELQMQIISKLVPIASNVKLEGLENTALSPAEEKAFAKDLVKVCMYN